MTTNARRDRLRPPGRRAGWRYERLTFVLAGLAAALGAVVQITGKFTKDSELAVSLGARDGDAARIKVDIASIAFADGHRGDPPPAGVTVLVGQITADQ